MPKSDKTPIVKARVPMPHEAPMHERFAANVAKKGAK